MLVIDIMSEFFCWKLLVVCTGISFQHYTCTFNVEQYDSPWCAKKVVSDWPGLVNFSVMLVNFIPSAY